MGENELTGLPLRDDCQEREATIAPAPFVAKDETHEMLRSLTPEERERVRVLQQLVSFAAVISNSEPTELRETAVGRCSEARDHGSQCAAIAAAAPGRGG